MKEHKDNDSRFSLYATQVQTYASFSGTMAAVVMFFTGLILSKFESLDISIKVPIAFMIISIFGFLYSALLYANAAQEVSDRNGPGIRKGIFLGDIVSEYLGVYLLVISIPLVINVITPDFFLRTVTIVSSLAGLCLYQLSHFSIVERHFKSNHRFVALLVIGLGLLLCLAQVYGVYFVPLSTAFGILILAIAYSASKSKHS